MPQLGLDHSMWEVGEILPDFHAWQSLEPVKNSVVYGGHAFKKWACLKMRYTVCQ
jgi:hypothetical protein